MATIPVSVSGNFNLADLQAFINDNESLRNEFVHMETVKDGTIVNTLSFKTLDADTSHDPVVLIAIPPGLTADQAPGFIDQIVEADFKPFPTFFNVFVSGREVSILPCRQMTPSFDPRGAKKANAAGAPGAAPADSSEVFKSFMPFIFEWEGETFENDPDDPGGATKFGIDKRSHPHEDIPNLTKDRAMTIYWEEWQKDGCPQLAPPYAQVFFNCAVNMGLGRARSFHKAAQGLPKPFLDVQEQYYQALGRNPRRAKFLRGWLNRTKALRDLFGLNVG